MCTCMHVFVYGCIQMSVAVMSHSSSSLQTHWNDIQQQHASVQAAAASATSARQLHNTSSASATDLRRLSLARFASAPHPHYGPGQATALFAHTPTPRKPPPAPVKATVVSAMEVTAAVAAVATPVAAHVLTDVADAELANRLQSRLASLGITTSMVKAEVRANETIIPGAANRTSILTLTGKMSVSLGSLFNMLVATFLRQHTQISSVERNVTFIPASASSSLKASGLSRTSTGNTLLTGISPVTHDETPCVDSPPILQLKVKHLAKLMVASAGSTVVYTGDQLCSTVVPTAAVSTSAGHHPLADLAAPHAPSVVAAWARQGIVNHIINENSEGVFNPISTHRSMDSLSEDEENSSVSSEEEAGTDTVHPPRRLLEPELLSELYGNKYVEVCSSSIGGQSGECDASPFIRNFQVASIRLPAPLRVASGSNNIASTVDVADPHHTGRFCPYCSSPLRDTLVGWNQPPARALLQRCAAAAASAVLSLVLGSHLRNNSAMAQLPMLPCVTNPLATVVIVQASTTAKDIECLERGGILIRATPAAMLAALQPELNRLRPERLPPKQHATPSICVANTSSSAIPRNHSSSSSSSNTSSYLPSVPVVRPTRPAATYLANSLSHTAMKRRRSGTSSVAAAAVSNILAQFSQRRIGMIQRGNALSKPLMGRAATAGAKLFSMAPPTVSGRVSALLLSASLPPFPRLDDEEAESEVMEDKNDMIIPSSIPRARSEERARAFASSLLVHGDGGLSRPSSVSSKGDDVVGGASMLTMMQSLTPVAALTVPFTPLGELSPESGPGVLRTPNYYRSLSPPPAPVEFGSLFTPLPLPPSTPMEEEMQL
jgi:hypothetical protein